MKLTLVLKSLRDRWRGSLMWLLGIFGLVAMMMYVFPSIKSTGPEMNAFINAMPEALVAIMRIEDYTSGTGYLGAELFSFMIPIIFIAVAASWAAAATAEEEERGTADLIYSLPVARWRIALSKLIAGWVTLSILAAATFVSIRVGSNIVDLSITNEQIIAITVAVAMMAITFGAVAAFVGSLSGHRGAALGAAIGFALACFMIYSLAPLVDLLDNIAPYQPYSWAVGANPIKNGVDWPGLGWLALFSAILYALSLVVISRRDIRA
ncbi:MAG: hypothetical protein RIR88_698 [Actinomycetota bacterium]|jgi:ABC-2 type transport system permease protein